MLNTIFHIDESQNWPVVISNLYHLREWLDANHDNGLIELVVNGEAVVDTVVDAKQDLSKLLTINVDVRVCQNSMNQRKIYADDLQSDLKIVPSGVVELALKQQAGFGYIKS